MTKTHFATKSSTTTELLQMPTTYLFNHKQTLIQRNPDLPSDDEEINDDDN